MDEMKLLKHAHSVGESNYHLQFTPKYRKKIFMNPVIKAECERVLLGIAKQMRIIVAVNTLFFNSFEGIHSHGSKKGFTNTPQMKCPAFPHCFY